MASGGEAVTLETARRWCREYETTLRGSFGPEKGLPDEWEKALEQVQPTSATEAVKRYALLKHFYLLRQAELEEAKTRAHTPPAEAQEAARQLLRREPVRVRLGGRTVDVTARSYAAMYHIAAHAAQVRALEADLEVAGRLSARTSAELRAAKGWRRMARLRRRIRRLRDVHVRAYRELQLQRRALYAHAFTPSGAPARSLEEAPGWWSEIDPAADAVLLAALIEAGHGRFARLGDPPEPKKAKRSKEKDGKADAGENFGWATLFSTVERQQRLPVAELYDQDLFQLRTWLRAGAPPPLELND